MQLEALLGNKATKAALKTSLAADKLPHAILLAAPDGCGRGFAARCLAADYLYPAGGAAAAAVMAGQSPELICIQGEGKSGQIPVDTIRAVRQEIFHSSLSASGRVVWIKDAQKMAAPAFNALLKVLEEPPEGAIFILTTADSSLLPPTILSRCVVYTLAPPALADCILALQTALPQNAAPGLPEMLSTLYDGRIGMGLQVLQNPARLATLQDALEAAHAAAKQDRYQLLRIFTGYEGRAEDDRQRRDDLLADISAVLRVGLRNVTAPKLPAIAPATAAHLLPPLAEARLALRGNANPKITFAGLCARLTAAAA